MKSFLVTTAMCLVLGTGLNGFVNSNDSTLSIVYDAQQFSETSSQKNVLELAVSMYRGDFQKISRSIISANLYSGESSAEMASIRMLRY